MRQAGKTTNMSDSWSDHKDPAGVQAVLAAVVNIQQSFQQLYRLYMDTAGERRRVTYITVTFDPEAECCCSVTVSTP